MLQIHEILDQKFELSFFEDYFKALKIIPENTSSLTDRSHSSPYIISNQSDDFSEFTTLNSPLEDVRNFNTYQDAVNALTFANKPGILYKRSKLF